MLQDFFDCKKQKVDVFSSDGTSKGAEDVVFTHVGKTSYNSYYENYLYRGLLSDSTKIAWGDILKDANSKVYFTLSRRDTLLSKIGRFQQANGSIEIHKVVSHYTANKVKDGYSLSDKTYSGDTYYKEVSGKMQQYDQGLLPSTVITFVMQSNSAIELNNRVSLGTNAYVVNYIDTTKYPNLYVLQCAKDDRVIKQ